MRTLHRLLPWSLGGLALATGLGLLAPFGWPFELFVHFRVQYAAAAALLAALLAWQRRPWLAAAAVVLAGWHAVPGVQGLLAVAPPAECNGPELRVATANVRYANNRREPFLAWLDAEPADLVVVQEVTAAWARDLAARRGYPHQQALTREDPYGIAVLSRWPLVDVRLVDLAGDGLPSIAGEVRVDGQRVRFLGLHTNWPITPTSARARDAALQRAAALAGESDQPFVLLGDLNLTPDSPPFTRLLADGELRDVMDGRRWRPTWRAALWPLALRIDHVLVSHGLCVEHAEVGPAIGSDHRPVRARLRLPRDPAGRSGAAQVDPVR